MSGVSRELVTGGPCQGGGPDLGGHHEEAEEPVGEQHLHFLVVAGQVALRVVALVRVGAAPLEARGRQLVGREGARAGGEAGGQVIR